jgi:hypothetical protein
MASSRKPQSQKNSKAMKEQLIYDPMLACRVQFEGSMFRRVPLLKCVYYNVTYWHVFLDRGKVCMFVIGGEDRGRVCVFVIDGEDQHDQMVKINMISSVAIMERSTV